MLSVVVKPLWKRPRPANEEANKIIAAAKAEADQQAIKAHEALREQAAALAVKGAGADSPGSQCSGPRRSVGSFED